MIYYIVGSLLAVATLTDILWRKVPNTIILAYFTVGAFTLNFGFVLRFIISLFIFSILYHLRFFGAGDVKLFSLIIGFLGTYEGVNMTIIALVLAGIGSLIYMCLSNQLTTRMSMLINYCIRVFATGKIERYQDYKPRDKYMIPIAPYFLLGFLLWRCFC